MRPFSRIYRSFTFLFAIAVFSGLHVFSTNQALASITTFNFVHEGTGDVLAVLELSSLPASPTEVNSLTFTTAGDAIFGYGVGAYSGSFVAPDGDMVIAEGLFGLMGDDINSFAYFTDASAPESDIYGVSTSLEMGFGSGNNLDYLQLFVAVGEGELYHYSGSWELVPEPTALLIWSSLGLTGLLSTRHRRRS